ncbi:PLP-dependent aminotransferase family protein [Actinospongicola halichondriae]|uniref:aminotransferase-like domain-containing protein n=1 Tax=Actinospongicola halichondriae TaxID=3236844 RepID=UPI003D38231D
MGSPERVDARALIGVLGDWSAGAGPLYRQLASALVSAVERGDLPPGMRLPAERSIAEALPVARNTVVAAFGLLVESGHVVRRQGSGSTVAGESRGDRPALAAGLRAQTLTGRALHHGGQDDPVELGLSVLDDPESLPAWAFDVDPVTVGRAGRGHGYAPLGIDALRDRVAELLTARGLPSASSEVAITLGAQHGIALAAEVLGDRGTGVAVEDPTYPGAIDVYSRAGLRFAAVDTDAGGTDPASLRRVLAGGGVGLVHLAPQCASPTGVVTVDARRPEILEFLRASDAWLVEDAALEFLAPPAEHGYLAASMPERSVVVGTTSKVLWGGLRVGWLRAPASVVERIGRLRAAHDLGSPVAPQVTALRLLDDIDDIADQRRTRAAGRRQYLRERILAAVPDVRIAVPDGGLSLWVEVEDADRLVADAATVGLDMVSGRVCSVTGGQTDRVRLSVWAPEVVLDEAARRFGVAWRLGRSDD